MDMSGMRLLPEDVIRYSCHKVIDAMRIAMGHPSFPQYTYSSDKLRKISEYILKCLFVKGWR
jgi:hypothetical protein